MILEGMTLSIKNNWMCEISKAFPEMNLEIVHFEPEQQGKWRGLLKTNIGKETKELTEWMQKTLSDVTLLRCENATCTQDCTSAHNCTIGFSTTAPPFSDILIRNKIFLQMPILLSDETIYLKVISTDENLQQFYSDFNQLQDCEVHIIKKFKQEEFTKARLTPKQEKIIQVAIDLGYYEVPRIITLNELAKRLGIAQSTLGEHLRKAEESIICSYGH